MTDKTSPSVQEAVQRIDAQILYYHPGPIQDLKSKRNALMPISRLPPEILGSIFHEVRGHNGGDQDDGYDNRPRTPFSYSKPSLKWISFSHVSRHWRSVAINDASLWTNPPLENPGWTMIMLGRSRLATIPVIALEVDKLDKRVVAALTTVIPRVSSLIIPPMASGTLKRVLSGLPSMAPMLEVLSINSPSISGRGNSWYHGATISDFNEAVTLPDNVLRHTPKLQHLQSNSVIIKANSPILSHLTTLAMSGIPEESKPTPHQFETMLKSAPCLKRLTLMGVCPSTESIQQKEWMAPILMQHLEYLLIEENIYQLSYFFRIFSVTHLFKALIIHVNCPEESASNLPTLFTALDQPYVHSIIGSSTDVRRLDISNTGGFFVRASKISLSERNLEPCDRRRPGDSESLTMFIDATCQEDMEDEDIRELEDGLLSDLFNGFNWSGLSEVDFTSLGIDSPQLLASTFGTVPQLRIIATDMDAPLLIKALSHHPDTQSNTSGSMLLSFPGLQHIDFGSTKLIQGEENFEAFLKCLQQRHESGIPLISLKFDHDKLEEQVVLKLKEYVEHIILTLSEDEHDVSDDYSPYNHTWYL